MKYLAFAITALLFVSCLPEEGHCPEEELLNQERTLEGQQWEWLITTESDGSTSTPDNQTNMMIEYSNGKYTRYKNGVVQEQMPYSTRPNSGDRIGRVVLNDDAPTNTIYYEQGTVKQSYSIEENTLVLKDDCDCREHTYRAAW